ncbi:MAG: hypothetical protein HOO06_11815 [Bdellovibrionaceae bacterium]|jgi:hypothetical protein|nr:hypothetical protein [Pseudobdellovibrionaceae bacterium]
MTKLSTLTTLFFVLGITNYAQATPRKHSLCNSSAIQSPENSAGFFFGEDCKQIYVLPPKEGTLEVTSFNYDLRALQCGAINHQVDKANEIIINLVEEDKKLTLRRSKIREQNAAVIAKRNKCFNFDPKVDKLKDKKNKVGSAIRIRQSKLVQLEDQYNSCSDQNASDCRYLPYDITSLKNQIQNFNAKSEIIDSAILSYTERKDSCLQNIDRYVTGLSRSDTELNSIINNYRKELNVLQSNMNLMYNNLAPIATSTLGIKYESHYVQLVEEFKSLNPGVNFNKMPNSSMALEVKLVRDGHRQNIPMVISSDIHAVSLAPTEISIDLYPAGIDLRPTANVVFSESLSGTMSLNQLGTCMITRRMENQTGVTNDLNEIAELIGGNVFYTYQLQTDRKFEFKYNEHELFRRIKKKSRKGGLFKTSVAQSLTEELNAKSWLQVKVTSEDSRNVYVDSQKMISEIRSEYLNRAIFKVAKYFVSKEQLHLLTPPSENGAAVASKELKKCPNPYCQFGAAVLDVANAIFGEAQSSASHTRTIDQMNWEKQVVSEMLPFTGSFGLFPKQRSEGVF